MSCQTRVGRLALALIVVTLAGCSSAATRTAGAPAPRPTVPSSSTAPRSAAAPAARITTTVRPAPGFHDATPPPTIHATGTDYVAIANSLLTYRDWLGAHHPDPALAASILQPGTITFDENVTNLTAMRTKHLTVASVDKHLTFTVVSVHDALVTFRLRETLVSDQWFDQAHRVVATTPYPQPNHYVVVMTRDSTRRWRIADITHVALDPAIVLAP